MPPWAEALLMWVGAAALAAPVIGFLLALGFAVGVGVSIYAANKVVIYLERKGLIP